MEKRFENNIKIGENVKIPDSDAVNWIRTLREAGLSDREIDSIMARLNKTYREQKGGEWVEAELKKIEDSVKQTGKSLTEEQKEYLRKSIRERE